MSWKPDGEFTLLVFYSEKKFCSSLLSTKTKDYVQFLMVFAIQDIQ